MCISVLENVSFNSCRIRRSDHIYKANFIPAISVDLTLIHSKRLLDLIALNAGNTKISASRRPLESCHKISVQRVEHKFDLFFEIICLPLLPSRKKSNAVDRQPIFLFCYPITFWVKKPGYNCKNRLYLMPYQNSFSTTNNHSEAVNQVNALYTLWIPRNHFRCVLGLLLDLCSYKGLFKH